MEKTMAYTDYFDTVQKAYIGYYQRAADPGGLIYWAERLDTSAGNLDEIIEAFANSAESQALYGTIDSANISSVVTSIYQAMFNRDPETAGLNYYVDGFNAGTFTAATIMLNVLNGAQNEDATSIQNKVLVADRFTQLVAGESFDDPDFGKDGNDVITYNGDNDAQGARQILKEVDADGTKTIPEIIYNMYEKGIPDLADSVKLETLKPFEVSKAIEGTEANDDIWIREAGYEGSYYSVNAKDGDDKVYCLTGSNWIFGGKGHDYFYNGSFTSGNILIGGEGSDSFSASGEDNVLIGGPGNDSLSGSGLRVWQDEVIKSYGVLIGGEGGDKFLCRLGSIDFSVKEEFLPSIMVDFDFREDVLDVGGRKKDIGYLIGDWAGEKLIFASDINTSDARVVAMNTTTFDSLSEALGAAKLLQEAAANKEYLVLWEDENYRSHLSYTVVGAENNESLDLFVLYNIQLVGVDVGEIGIADFNLW